MRFYELDELDNLASQPSELNSAYSYSEVSFVCLFYFLFLLLPFFNDEFSNMICCTKNQDVEQSESKSLWKNLVFPSLEKRYFFAGLYFFSLFFLE